jgi:coenzyme PQQ precursor peptide PqqA
LPKPDTVKNGDPNDHSTQGFDTAQLPTPNSGSASMRRFQEETTTTWILPRILEIAVGLEINCYACAELN